MSTSSVTIRDLLENGVHYGHTTRRWNPKMAPYIFGERNGIHIIDLRQTLPLLEQALEAARLCASKGGRILFVGTKNQATSIIKEAAERCGQYFINHRWLGGTLTNWKTVNQSIKRMKEMAEELENPEHMTKKEILKLRREHEKLERALGGVSEMGGLPDMVFILDTNKEDIAVLESKRLGIPVIAVLDSNSDPENVTYPIPGNDDASRAITLYCDLLSTAILEGLQEQMVSAGFDLGESEELSDEMLEKVGEDAKKTESRKPAGKGKPNGGKPSNGRDNNKAHPRGKATNGSKASAAKKDDKPKAKASTKEEAASTAEDASTPAAE